MQAELRPLSMMMPAPPPHLPPQDARPRIRGLPEHLPPVAAPPRRIARGLEIYAEGSAADHVYTVASGAVRVCRFLLDGRRLIAQFALPGEIFGLESTDRHRFAAEAVTDAVVIPFPKREVEAWLAREPQAAQSWRRLIQERLAEAQDRFVQLGWRNARERLAGFLIELSDHAGPNGDAVELAMSRYDIGDYLGLTAETVSRLFSQFRACRMIEDRGAHGIRILDRARLEQLAGGEA
jgi:CRP-like cAMP-binding protein